MTESWPMCSTSIEQPGDRRSSCRGATRVCSRSFSKPRCPRSTRGSCASNLLRGSRAPARRLRSHRGTETWIPWELVSACGGLGSSPWCRSCMVRKSTSCPMTTIPHGSCATPSHPPRFCVCSSMPRRTRWNWWFQTTSSRWPSGRRGKMCVWPHNSRDGVSTSIPRPRCVRSKRGPCVPWRPSRVSLRTWPRPCSAWAGAAQRRWPRPIRKSWPAFPGWVVWKRPSGLPRPHRRLSSALPKRRRPAGWPVSRNSWRFLGSIARWPRPSSTRDSKAPRTWTPLPTWIG